MQIGDKVKTIDFIYEREGAITWILDNGLITFKDADGIMHHFWAENLKVIEEASR